VGAGFSAPVQTGPEAHPASCTIGTGSFLGVKSGQGVKLAPHTFLKPLNLYSRYGQYGLYRDSGSVQEFTLLYNREVILFFGGSPPSDCRSFRL